jgi:hypothetical protein
MKILRTINKIDNYLWKNIGSQMFGMNNFKTMVTIEQTIDAHILPIKNNIIDSISL